MTTAPPEMPGRRVRRRVPLTPTATLLLALSFGLCAGFLEVGAVVFKKYYSNTEGHYRNARDFPWTIPVAQAFLMMVPVVLVVVVNRLRPVSISLRMGVWLFATLAMWSALLRIPLYGPCSFLLAAGVGRIVADAIAAYGFRPRIASLAIAALLGTVAVLAGATSGWRVFHEYRTVAGLSPAAPSARNVVLIVWDTVRTLNLGLYGYSRKNTPNLEKWASKGVTYRYALSPAPWTFPSHASFFTGRWPFQLNTQLKFRLDTASPTLAEHLTSSGYQTAGFAANTSWCSYETGLDRGFAHYEDYSLTPVSLLGRAALGQMALKGIVNLVSLLDRRWIDNTKWIDHQSRGASQINDSFFGWMSQRRRDRPFFAFLNYFDAHEPYLAPLEYRGRSGIMPASAEDFRFLTDFATTDKSRSSARNLEMARDSYDDCIALLDDQLGHLLDDLQSRGLLENTDVIITSDHGEAFGVHHYFGHDNTVNFEEIGVPLVILSAGAPAGSVVDGPVSLRDLPATVVDLLGLSASSPFAGRSLAALWKLAPGADRPGLTSPALSEKLTEPVFEIASENGRRRAGFEMSLVASGHHYIRDSLGDEQLYDLSADLLERGNLAGPTAGTDALAVFRRKLLDALTDNPGSAEVEKAYLATYRRWLEDLVGRDASKTLTDRDRIRVDRPGKTLASGH